MQARAKAKVEAILHAAETLLVDEGPEALNTNRIAAEAGVGVGTVYEYFGNKEGIALVLIERLSEAETTAIRTRLAAIPEDDIDAAALAAIEEAFALYQQHAALLDGLRAMTKVRQKVGTRPGERAILQAVEARLARVGVSDPERVAFTMFHLVESLALRFTQQDRWNLDEAITETTRVVRAYLKDCTEGSPSSTPERPTS